MPQQQGVILYSQGFGSVPERLIHLDVRAPATTDIRFGQGQLWLNTLTNSFYGLGSLSSSQGATTANWALLGTATGALNTLTGDSGGAISPSAGNITLAGTASEITTTGSGSTITFSFPSSMVAPGSLTATGLLTGDAGATLNTAGTAMNIATDTDTAAVNIATAGARTTTIGDVSGASGMVLHVGTGNFVLDGVAGSTYAIGASTTTGTITIGGTSQTGSITLGDSAGTNTVGVGTGNGPTSVNIGGGTGGNSIYINNGVNTGVNVVDIAAGAAAANSTVNVLSGNATAGTQTLNLATGTGGKVVHVADGAGANTVTVGSTNTTSTTTVQSGTGGLVLSGGQVVSVTGVTSAGSPYTLLGTDQVVAVDPTGGVVTVTLPAAPATGRFVTVVDATGQAATHNITVSGNGKNISSGGASAATATLSTAYSSLNLWYNGTIWNAQKIS